MVSSIWSHHLVNINKVQWRYRNRQAPEHYWAVWPWPLTCLSQNQRETRMLQVYQIWWSSVQSLFTYHAERQFVSRQCFDTVGWATGKGIRPVNSSVLVDWWWRFDCSFARLVAPIVTATFIIFDPMKLANPGSPGKMTVKTDRERERDAERQTVDCHSRI